MDSPRQIKGFSLSQQNRFKDLDLQHIDDVPRRRGAGRTKASLDPPYDVRVRGSKCHTKDENCHVTFLYRLPGSAIPLLEWE